MILMKRIQFPNASCYNMAENVWSAANLFIFGKIIVACIWNPKTYRIQIVKETYEFEVIFYMYILVRN